MDDKLRAHLGIPKTNPTLNPWLLILLTAPVPLVLMLFFFYKWYQGRTDVAHVTREYVERQNAVIAQDALRVAAEVAGALEDMVEDLKQFSLYPPDPEKARAFFNSPDAVIAYYSPVGKNLWRVENGKVQKAQECSEKRLCDRKLIEKLMSKPVNAFEIGRLLKWYAPEGMPDRLSGAGLSVGLRTDKGIIVQTLPFQQFQNFLQLPTFPYLPKTDLLAAYQSGNYIYIVDSQHRIIAHPKPWHVSGMEEKSGEWVRPMETDEEGGKHPIEISRYKEGKLKQYFERLLNRSFKGKGVDIFQGPNLAGQIRVLAVAPIRVRVRLAPEQIFGHVILGCSVNFFEEPKNAAPYY